jgi:hypothetical protein
VHEIKRAHTNNIFIEHTCWKGIVFLGDGDFFLIIIIGVADEIVLNLRRPLIINGRKSIGLTSIFDDIGE